MVAIVAESQPKKSKSGGGAALFQSGKLIGKTALRQQE